MCLFILRDDRFENQLNLKRWEHVVVPVLLILYSACSASFFLARTVFFSHNISARTVFFSRFQPNFSEPNGPRIRQPVPSPFLLRLIWLAPFLLFPDGRRAVNRTRQCEINGNAVLDY